MTKYCEQYMINKLFNAILIAVCSVAAHAQESIERSAITAWGNSVCDVRLSIGLSTNTITAGTNIIFYTRIENLSTNVVTVNPRNAAPYVLTNDTGSSYQVMPIYGNISLRRSPPKLLIKPGEIREWHESIKFNKDMEVGIYEIEPVKRDVTTFSNHICTIISEPLTIKIVK
jgi:hypothetical protein